MSWCDMQSQSLKLLIVVIIIENVLKNLVTDWFIERLLTPAFG